MAHPTSEEQRVTDRVDPARAAGLLALLDAGTGVNVGQALPPLAHLLYFWDIAGQAELGDDGHIAPGVAMPETGLSIRMWAGGRLTFHAPFRAGVLAERTSRVTAVTRKSGRSGDLAFVTIRHLIRQSGGPVLTEEQDLVYRADGGAPEEVPRAEEQANEGLPIRFDAVRLFRYSALTFNAHRIHYDHPFCRVHGYEGLVVHGPLLATVLAMMAEDRLGGLSRFSFRATAPLYGGEPARLCRSGGKFWIEGPERRLCMTAEARA